MIRTSPLRASEFQPVCRANDETGATGLEPATSGVTGRRSNQLNYAPAREALYRRLDPSMGGDGIEPPTSCL
jgi:hypothetical protein